jgi:hypothetical protein
LLSECYGLIDVREKQGQKMSRMFLPAVRERRVNKGRIRVNRMVGSSGGVGDENRPHDPFYTVISNHSGGSQVFDGKKFVENSNQPVLHLEVMVVEFGENMCS